MGKQFNYIVLTALVILAHAVLFHSFANPTLYNQLVFKRSGLTGDEDRFQTVKCLSCFISVYLLIFSIGVMTYRIFSGKTNPAAGKDSDMINTFNRIITNTVQQTIIFGGLYLNFLYGNTDLKSQIVLLLASLFVIARTTYAIGYVLATATQILTLRSFGVAINFAISILMALYFFGVNLAPHLEGLLK